MIRSDRLSSAARDRGVHLAAAGAERLAGALRGRKKSVLLAGIALALAGAGSASAATVTGSTPALPAPTALTSAAPHAVTALAPKTASAAAASHRAASHRAASLRATSRVTGGKTVSHHPRVLSWTQVRNAINQQADPASARHGILPLAGQLVPVGIAGPQAWMPLSPGQLTNATTIVRQDLSKKMGIRSAVIAVATAMQESQLLNLHYGDLDSLGLFQQRPSMGWGTAAQITDPAFAAKAFLGALQRHQATDPTWARQPLWASAQAVQNSGFPLAYAKWESQAAGLVKQIAMRLR
jgi:hypothetical protein